MPRLSTGSFLQGNKDDSLVDILNLIDVFQAEYISDSHRDFSITGIQFIKNMEILLYF